MHYNCLIVDDEKELAQMTCEYFNLFDVASIWTDSVKGCEELLAEHTVDILLLDINLQEESGFALCKKIRDTSDIPILFISARQSDEDILVALNIGGDDYIKKPFSLNILLAKVKAMLKRVNISQNNVMQQNSGNFWLDESTMRVGVGEKEVQLKAKEFKLLSCLFEHRNTIVTKEVLFDTVWGDTFFSDGTLNVHIRKLREKLEENPNEPKLIKTVWGTGYILEIHTK
ncbi:MAG: response regulator transcription factor [Lachnospiraceae bacterium]|nr:response regulator transcription factor [Lachnospiraceae bacterium]